MLSALKKITKNPWGSGGHASPGQVITIGTYKVEIVKQLGEGGFAFVFLAKDVETQQPYAVKRLTVNDPDDMKKVQEEIDFMKRIPKHRNIVEFYSAAVYTPKDKPYCSEVLILMEYCPGPSLYELLDSNYKNYFPEAEVLNIFSDVCDGIAHLHSINPPIAHRDLKVENVLKQGNCFKLCDFGSATQKTYLPESAGHMTVIEEDINRYTTMSYRSPEMIDLWRRQLINEKVDIWALGCLLYRVAFFRHPFEEGGNLQILNVNYEIPRDSPYSHKLHDLIKYIIEQDPDKRPTIFQVISRVSELRGVPVNHTYSNVIESSFDDSRNQHNLASSKSDSSFFSTLEWSAPSSNSTPSSPARSAKIASSTPPRSPQHSSHNKTDLFSTSFFDQQNGNPAVNSTNNSNQNFEFDPRSNSPTPTRSQSPSQPQPQSQSSSFANFPSLVSPSPNPPPPQNSQNLLDTFFSPTPSQTQLQPPSQPINQLLSSSSPISSQQSFVPPPSPQPQSIPVMSNPIALSTPIVSNQPPAPVVQPQPISQFTPPSQLNMSGLSSISVNPYSSLREVSINPSPLQNNSLNSNQPIPFSSPYPQNFSVQPQFPNPAMNQHNNNAYLQQQYQQQRQYQYQQYMLQQQQQQQQFSQFSQFNAPSYANAQQFGSNQSINPPSPMRQADPSPIRQTNSSPMRQAIPSPNHDMDEFASLKW